MKNYTCLFILALFLLFSGIVSGEEKNSDITIKSNSGEIRIATTYAELIIRKSPWKLSLLGKDGILRYTESAAPAFRINDRWVFVEKILHSGKADSATILLWIQLSGGTKGVARIRPAGGVGFSVSISCPEVKITAIRGVAVLNPVEEIYGFGEMWNGHVAQRGQAFDQWDKGGTPDECAYMPYYVSTNNYAFYLNYGGLVHFDVGKSNSTELVWQAETQVADYTLLASENIEGAVKNFQAVTGMPACPPRWAFEPWFWLMNDPDKPGSNISTLRGEHFPYMIKKLKVLDIPVGVTWLEPPWQDARTSFIPNREFCVDLKGLIAEISDLGVKTLAWTVPYTTNTASNWKEAVAKGYLVRKPSGKKTNENFTITTSGELVGNFYTAIDFFNPEAAAWWQRQVEQSLDLGLKGYKLDAGQDLPADAILFGGRVGRDVHNSYALEYDKVYYHAFKNKLGDDFLMIPRAAWTGSVTFTNFKWPGDLAGDFASNGLPSTVYSSLSLAMSGMPFVSTDIGGFEGRPAPENIWIRWAQFGAFLPGMQTLHMPWWYSAKAVQHFRYLAWLHTDLIPFWASLAYKAHTIGSPVIRPLVLDYQNDVNCWRADDEFTAGNSILVAPILNTNPDRSVYLPEGVWYDFWDETQTVTGPKMVNWFKGWNETLFKFPVFIRSGSIIPMEISNDVTGFGSESSKGYITLAIWPEKEGKSELILKNRKDTVLIRVISGKENQISVSWGKTSENYIFRVHPEPGKKPLALIINKITIKSDFTSLASFRAASGEGWYFDETTGNLWVRKLNKGESGSMEILTN